MQVEPGTIVVYSDIACPWATLAMHRLHAARERLGLSDRVRFDLRAFPLELFNNRPTPKRTLDAEWAVISSHAPDFGWSGWRRPDWEYPGTMLLALEAVQAAKAQGLAVSECLDLDLRRGLFRDSRCISLRHVIVEIAQECAATDADLLAAALDDGRARKTVIEQWHCAETDQVRGSPHLFLPDGSDNHNPGITMHWHGEKRGFPIIDSDDPSVYDELLTRAVA
ncbi:MAG: DsbA family protein [Mycobacteriales bacterium]|nr:DsbA family protein [Frankia sp.]